MNDNLGPSHYNSIKATKLRVQKGRQILLDNLNFSIQPGNITGLIGPSGAGKTTLMRTIVGLQRLTSGELSVLGQPAGNKVLRQKIGYVTQEPSVYSDLTVKQNLSFFATLIRAPKSDVDRVMHEVELMPQAKQLVKTLSGGQRARVSLAVALLGDPDLLVLDEPTVGLDPILRNNLWELFAKLARSGKTLLVSSHVMDEAERCENLILIRDAQLLWQDSKDALLKANKVTSVEAAFLKLAGQQGGIK